MYSVVEIDKTFTYEGEFTPYSPYVYESIVTVNSGLQVESIATYWTSTFGADGTYNTVATQIESMTLDSIFELAKQDSLVDCQSTQSSFYFDATLQVLYVHISHTDNLLSHSVETGVLYGYCSDTVRYFRNQLYRPIVQSIPSLSDQADPLQYGIMAFGGGSIVFTNDVTSGLGLFDTDEKLYGNPVRIKRGKEGDDYDDLVLVFSGYVKDIETTTATMTLEVGDKRERLEVEYPVYTIEYLDNYNTDTSEWETSEVIQPDGYGDVIQAPAYPMEVEDGISVLSFDGVNDYVSIPYNSSLYPTSEIRLEVSAYMDIWKHNDPVSDKIISCHQSGGWALGSTEDGISFQLRINNNYQYANVEFENISNGWHDFVGTFDGRYVKLYMDTILQDTIDMGGTYPISYSGNYDILIGADPNGASNPTANSYWQGRVKDINLYSDADGTTQLASWAIDEGLGTTVEDTIGSHNGTIHGASWVSIDGIRYTWGSSITSITQVYTEQDNTISPVTHFNSLTSGYFSLQNSDAYIDGNTTKGLRKVYVTGRMRDYDNPADIIADLNDRVVNIEYNASNYNQTEWTSEKALLADVSLYMDEPKRLYEWIEILQAGSDYGFRYEDTDKITLRVDDKERTPITFADGTTYIRPVEIRNSDIPIKHNAQLYASSCIVKYAKNWRHGHYSQVTNSDYETDVLKEHRIKKIQTYESLLTNSTDADSKALIVMSDVSEVRPIVEIVVDSEKWLGSSGGDMPRIFDIVNIEASLLTHGSSIPTEWTFVLGDTLLLGDDDIVLGERYKATRTEAYTDSRGKRIYAGEMECQVIGVEPNLETDEIKLRLRKIG
jgi:hypothetical protein